MEAHDIDGMEVVVGMSRVLVSMSRRQAEHIVATGKMLFIGTWIVPDDAPLDDHLSFALGVITANAELDAAGVPHV